MLPMAWLASNGVKVADKIDGEVKYLLNQEPAIEVLNFLRDIFAYRGGGAGAFIQEM